MSRIVSQAFVIGIISLFSTSNLLAESIVEEIEPSTETKEAEKNKTPTWVGITVLNKTGETEYFIGTIPAFILTEIELDKYARRFLRLTNLRIQGEEANEYNEKKLTHYNCSDKYDWGIILIQFKDILSVEFKKRDPLTVY